MSTIGASGSTAGDSKPSSLFEFHADDIHGKPTPFSRFRGYRAFLIVNVASQCGLTETNYSELADLEKLYKDRGFLPMLFPCNQFKSQESGTHEEIEAFIKSKGLENVAIFSKVKVNGKDAHPLFQWLKETKPSFGSFLFGADLKWNFAKFLVDHEGNVVESYLPTTAPSAIVPDIEKLLNDAEEKLGPYEPKPKDGKKVEAADDEAAAAGGGGGKEGGEEDL